jgi:hypothetical protein
MGHLVSFLFFEWRFLTSGFGRVLLVEQVLPATANTLTERHSREALKLSMGVKGASDGEDFKQGEHYVGNLYAPVVQPNPVSWLNSSLPSLIGNKSSI